MPTLRRGGLKRGIVTLCIGGGQGIALRYRDDRVMLRRPQRAPYAVTGIWELMKMGEALSRGLRGGANLRLGAACGSTKSGAKAFAAEFDPQPFHLDEEAGAPYDFRWIGRERAGIPRRRQAAGWSRAS